MPFMYEPDYEIVTYRSIEECLEKICYLNNNPEECYAIGRRASDRACRDHSYEVRIPVIIGHLRRLLGRRSISNGIMKRPTYTYLCKSLYIAILVIVTYEEFGQVQEKLYSRLECLRKRIADNKQLDNRRIALFSLLNLIDATDTDVCLWNPDNKSNFEANLSDFLLTSEPSCCIIIHNGLSVMLTQAAKLVSEITVPCISYDLNC